MWPALPSARHLKSAIRAKAKESKYFELYTWATCLKNLALRILYRCVYNMKATLTQTDYLHNIFGPFSVRFMVCNVTFQSLYHGANCYSPALQCVDISVQSKEVTSFVVSFIFLPECFARL